MADSILVGDWIGEKCDTVGTDTLNLTGQISKNYAKFVTQVNEGPVPYTVVDQNGNKEVGIGIFDGISKITRNPVGAIVDGTYLNVCQIAIEGGNIGPIELSGVSRVYCTNPAVLANITADHVIENLDPDPSEGFTPTVGLTGIYNIGGTQVTLVKGHIQEIEEPS